VFAPPLRHGGAKVKLAAQTASHRHRDWNTKKMVNTTAVAPHRRLLYGYAPRRLTCLDWEPAREVEEPGVGKGSILCDGALLPCEGGGIALVKHNPAGSRAPAVSRSRRPSRRRRPELLGPSGHLQRTDVLRHGTNLLTT